MIAKAISKIRSLFTNSPAGNQLILDSVLTQLFGPIKLDKCTRIEMIDKNGRSYVNWQPGNKISLSFQDEGRTLKVFVQEQ